MTPDLLTAALLAKPVGPAAVSRRQPSAPTRSIELAGDRAEVELKASAGQADEGNAVAFLRERGEDPAEWEVVAFRGSEWTMANGELGESNRYSFRRKAGTAASDRPDVGELIAAVRAPTGVASATWPDGDVGFVLALGDMQFGKIDGDGAAGALARTLGGITRAASVLAGLGNRYDIGHVHVAWLGDHIEGFVSQGGANVWRTTLTLSEQIRLARRCMLYAAEIFAPLAARVTMAAVPGNHGEPQRFAGKGITRYDDSHDTESLIAVADAMELAPDRFGHVQCLVPDTDEMTVHVDVAGTRVAHAHGHQWRPGKHFEWWRGQAFNTASPMHDAHLLLAGHLHHLHVDTDGRRLFVQPPALESESTWWRHAKGTTGDPGMVVAVTKDGRTDHLEVVR